MTEQRTPDELSRQNELICEKLLGWQRSARGAIVAWSGWHNGTPTFTTWAEAGLILEALGKCAEFPRIGQRTGDLHWYCALRGGVATIRESGPLAIRSAALEYIRRQS